MPFKDNKIFNAVLICLLFIIAFAYFRYGYHYFDQGTYHYDEGLVAYGAVRVLNADMPYRDFWTLYAPGVFYLLAFIFKIFGISIEVTRLFAITILSLTVCSIYLLIKKLSSRLFGLFAFLLSLLWLKSYMVFDRPGQFAILFFIFSSFSLIKFLNSGKYRWLVITGVLSGIAGLFRQDFGVYIFISLFLVILSRQLNRFQEKKRKEKLILLFKSELYLCLGCFMVILPVFIYLAFNSAFKEFVNDAVFFPAIIYPKVRKLPFPEFKPDGLIYYLPLFVFLLTCIRLLFYNWRNKIEDTPPWMGLFFLFSGLGFFNYTNTRTCLTHLLPTMIPAIILFSLLFDDFIKTFFTKSLRTYKNFIWLIVCFILISFLTEPSLEISSKKIIPPPKTQEEGILNINRARGFYDEPDFAYSLNSAIRYIQDKTAKNEKIFVGNLRHDKVINSDATFYFLSERDSATRYYELHPGLTNMPQIQQKIINDLIKANVRYIVLWSGSEKIQTSGEPNESSKSYGAFALDDFIREKYKTEKIFGHYTILKRIRPFRRL